MMDSVNSAEKIVSLAISLYQKIAPGEATSNRSPQVDFSKLTKLLTDLSSLSFLFEICPHCGQLILQCPHCDRAFENAEALSGHYDNCDGAN